MKYLDPDGEKLYFASNVSEKFKQQFAATVQFMNSKGTAGDLAKLDASEVAYYIGETKIGNKQWNSFNSTTKTILWDPNTIFESEENIRVSPATMLAHEAAHAAKYDEVLNSGDSDLISEYKKSRLVDKSNAYGSEEEEQVVTKTEQSVAKKHGEIRKNQVTRKGHKGGSFIPILNNEEPSELSKIIFEHNNLLYLCLKY